MNKRLKNLYIKMIILGISIITYFLILQYKYGEEKMIYYDPLNVKRFYIPFYGKISGWPVSHIISYAIFTYQYPEYWYHIIFLGMLWEVVEYCFNYYQAGGKNVTFHNTRTKNSIEYTNWWEASTQDIVWNSLGGIIGMTLSRTFKK
tara:strand:- start:72 stop:512 length:441 start_codon:yes stop_codon:yes gene_type:complete